ARVQRDDADAERDARRLLGGGGERGQPVDGPGVIHPERVIAERLGLARGRADHLGWRGGEEREAVSHCHGLLFPSYRVAVMSAPGRNRILIWMCALWVGSSPPPAISSAPSRRTSPPSWWGASSRGRARPSWSTRGRSSSPTSPPPPSAG